MFCKAFEHSCTKGSVFTHLHFCPFTGAGWCAGMLWRTARNLILKCFWLLYVLLIFLSVRGVFPSLLYLSLAGRACSIQWLWYSICSTPYSLVQMGIHLCDHLRCCCQLCLALPKRVSIQASSLVTAPGRAEAVAAGRSARKFLVVTVQFILVGIFVKRGF